MNLEQLLTYKRRRNRCKWSWSYAFSQQLFHCYDVYGSEQTIALNAGVKSVMIILQTIAACLIIIIIPLKEIISYVQYFETWMDFQLYTRNM